MKKLFSIAVCVAMLATTASANNAERLYRINRFLDQNNMTQDNCVIQNSRFIKCQGYGTVTVLIDTASAIICIQNTNLALNYDTGQEDFSYPCDDTLFIYRDRPREEPRRQVDRVSPGPLLRQFEQKVSRMMDNLTGVVATSYQILAFCEIGRRGTEGPRVACETTEGKWIYLLKLEEPLVAASTSNEELACSYNRGVASAEGYEKTINNELTIDELNDICRQEGIRYGLLNQ